MGNLAPIWISIAAAAISTTSALIAFLSYRLARQTLRLNRQLADRRQPRLLVFFQDGHIKKSGANSTYELLIAISNPTDVDNAVAQIDLRVDYRPPSDFRARVDIPAAPQKEGEQNTPAATVLVAPVKVGAHQTTTGWVRFNLHPALLTECKVDAYTVVVRDSHGESSFVEISVLREVTDET